MFFIDKQQVNKYFSPNLSSFRVLLIAFFYLTIFFILFLSCTVQANENSPEINQVENLPANTVDANKFDIFEYQVEGNTKLPQVQIEKAVYKFLGEKKTFADVSAARDALEKAYHDAGYLTVLVDIPEQEVNKKVVKLNVTEGKVGRLRVKDSDYFSLGRIKQVASSLKEGEVPHFPSVEEDISKLNRTADRRVTPVMKAGKKYGTVDVELKVEDKLPVHANLELNDRYSQDTSRWRLGGSIRYDNLWDKDHSISANFLTAPENTEEVKVISGNYLMRFDKTDALLALYAVKSKSNVATVGGINVLGDGTILGARFIKPLPALDNYFHSLSLGLDYKDFGQTVQFGSSNETPVKYAPFSASYTGTWQGEASATQLTTTFNFGFRDFLSDENEFEAKRAGARPNFFVSKVELEHTKNFVNGAQGFIKLDGQFTGAPLISNEQYLAGGFDTVRGYLESQASGDRALHATVELRSPRLLKNVTWINDFKLLSFFDVAQLSTIDAAEGQDDNVTISGAGLGLQLQAFNHVNMNWYLAWALKDYATVEKGDLQSHLRLWYEF